MIYFSSLLKTDPKYKPAADEVLAALDSHGVPYGFLEHTRDIWARDYMPVRTRTGKWVSFRYAPGYLTGEHAHLRTEEDARQRIYRQLALENVICSPVNLDGGNVVFSPAGTKALVSDRVFAENEDYTSAALVRELERLLAAQVIILPSLRSDMTGHADGMVRFLDETTVLGNRSRYLRGLEWRIKGVLRDHGLDVIDFPYFSSPGDSAVGCYLNFLETERHLFLPVFGADMDEEAVAAAERLFAKTVVPVRINEIAAEGGCLNCISWEK